MMTIKEICKIIAPYKSNTIQIIKLDKSGEIINIHELYGKCLVGTRDRPLYMAESIFKNDDYFSINVFPSLGGLVFDNKTILIDKERVTE